MLVEIQASLAETDAVPATFQNIDRAQGCMFVD